MATNLPTVLILAALVMAVLVTVAPLAIWIHTGRAARSARRQEALLRELVEAHRRADPPTLEARMTDQRASRGGS